MCDPQSWAGAHVAVPRCVSRLAKAQASWVASQVCQRGGVAQTRRGMDVGLAEAADVLPGQAALGPDGEAATPGFDLGNKNRGIPVCVHVHVCLRLGESS